MKVRTAAKRKKMTLLDQVKTVKTFDVQPANPSDVERATAYLKSVRSRLKADGLAVKGSAPYERGVLAGFMR